jgi:hypothetical protein
LVGLVISQCSKFTFMSTSKIKLGVMAQACDSSYPGGGGEFKASPGKLVRPCLKNKTQNKMVGVMASGRTLAYHVQGTRFTLYQHLPPKKLIQHLFLHLYLLI